MQTASPKCLASPGVVVANVGSRVPKAAIIPQISSRNCSRHISSPATNLHSIPILPSHGLVPRASSRSSSSATPSPQRSFSVMQNAMKIPGLASALNLIGVNGTGGADSGSSGASANIASSMAAVGANGASSSSPGPEDTNSQYSSASPHGGYQSDSQGHPQPNQLDPVEATVTAGADMAADAAADAVYDLAAAAAASNSNPPVPQGQSSSLLEAMVTSAKAAAAAAVNGRSMPVNGHANGHTHSRHGGSNGDEPVTIVRDAIEARVENNIMPYVSEGPSLAFQIREIAITLRAINALRLEYLEKIAQQEMQIEAREQALRGRDERIQALEDENVELRRSLGLLQSAKDEGEAEIQRLRAASTSAAIPPASSQVALPPSPSPSWPSPSPTSSTDTATMTSTPSEPAAAAAATLLGPHPLTSPPAAVASDAPALATTVITAPTVATEPEPEPPAAATPPPPPPPPPPRVPEVVLLYRSSWADAYLHVNVEGRGWTALPGLKMEHAGQKEYSARVQGRSIEFVLTNGQGDWDSPGGPGRNYRIDNPGEYRLQHGAIVQLKTWQP